MAFLIFSGEDYYPGGGWSDHDRTCATYDEAYLATMKLRGDWLQIVELETGKRTDFLWANNQWMTEEDARDWNAAEAAKANAEFNRNHVRLPVGAAFCGNCEIGYGVSWCSCGKYKEVA